MLPRRLPRDIRLLCTLAFLVFALQGSSATAIGETDVLPRMRQAALTLREARTYDFAGRVVRCQPNQQVGIMAESHGNLAITNVVVDGCRVGIVATGPSVRVEGATIRDTEMCMFLAGSGGTVSHNSATRCTIGIVVTGNGNTLTDNQSNDNIQDGILVTGDANLLEGNEVLRNGEVGIHVVRMVAMVAENGFLPFIQDLATGNVIRGNRASDNKVDLEEFGDCVVAPLPNQWINNRFRTGRPDCIE